MCKKNIDAMRIEDLKAKFIGITGGDDHFSDEEISNVKKSFNKVFPGEKSIVDDVLGMLKGKSESFMSCLASLILVHCMCSVQLAMLDNHNDLVLRWMANRVVSAFGGDEDKAREFITSYEKIVR